MLEFYVLDIRSRCCQNIHPSGRLQVLHHTRYVDTVYIRDA